jgi:hypothetical protein
MKKPNASFSYLFLLLSLFFFQGCNKKMLWHAFQIPSNTFAPLLKRIQSPEKKVIIIFIHGTILGNNKPEEPKARTQGLYHFQIIDKLGLQPIKEAATSTQGPLVAAENYARAYYTLHQDKNSLECFTFGWDGALNNQSRFHWAKKLYFDLINLLKEKQLWQNPDCEIELHGFSHGGNVALNLAQAEKEYQQGIVIDRLCLWGLPVQEETGKYINDPCFKEIYHFYSKKDKIQIFDIFSTARRRSYKCFDKILSPLPKKLWQINIEINGIHPSHYEFWYLGFAESAYRASFPIYPYPLVHYTPILLHLISAQEIKNRSLTIKGRRKKDTLTFRIKPIIHPEFFFNQMHLKKISCTLDTYGISSTKLHL